MVGSRMLFVSQPSEIEVLLYHRDIANTLRSDPVACMLDSVHLTSFCLLWSHTDSITENEVTYSKYLLITFHWSFVVGELAM